MPTVSSDSPPLREFAAALGARDPKTVATYLTTVRDAGGVAGNATCGNAVSSRPCDRDSRTWLHGFPGHCKPRATHTEQSPLSVAPLLPVGRG